MTKRWRIEQEEKHIVRQLYTVEADTAEEAERLLSEGEYTEMETLDMQPTDVVFTYDAKQLLRKVPK